MTLTCRNKECRHELATPVQFCPFCGTPAKVTVASGEKTSYNNEKTSANIEKEVAARLIALRRNLKALLYCAPEDDIETNEIFAAACARFIAAEGLNVSAEDTDEILRLTENSKQRILSPQDFQTQDISEPIIISFV